MFTIKKGHVLESSVKITDAIYYQIGKDSLYTTVNAGSNIA